MLFKRGSGEVIGQISVTKDGQGLVKFVYPLCEGFADIEASLFYLFIFFFILWLSALRIAPKLFQCPNCELSARSLRS